MSTSKTKWVLDPTHSEISFKIKHLMITSVTGYFNKFEATADTKGEDFISADISAKIEVESINTNNEQRDEHLRTADFFEVEKYPFITFKSTRIQRVDDENFNLFGDLTIKETTKPVKFALEYGGITKDAWGNTKAGFSLTGRINRHDFGVSYNPILETGNVALGEEIKISAEVQLVRQLELEPA